MILYKQQLKYNNFSGIFHYCEKEPNVLNSQGTWNSRSISNYLFLNSFVEVSVGDIFFSCLAPKWLDGCRVTGYGGTWGMAGRTGGAVKIKLRKTLCGGNLWTKRSSSNYCLRRELDQWEFKKKGKKTTKNRRKLAGRESTLLSFHLSKTEKNIVGAQTVVLFFPFPRRVPN